MKHPLNNFQILSRLIIFCVFFSISHDSDLIENAKNEAEFLFNDFEINSKKLEQLNEIFQNKNALISLGG